MQARDAIDEVERAVGEREVLPVGLDALEGADMPLVELAAAEPDHRVGQDVEVATYSTPRGTMWSAPQQRAAPTSSTRWPGST